MSPSIKFGLYKTTRGSKEAINEVTGTKNPFFSKIGDKNSTTKHTSRLADPPFD